MRATFFLCLTLVLPGTGCAYAQSDRTLYTSGRQDRDKVAARLSDIAYHDGDNTVRQRLQAAFPDRFTVIKEESKGNGFAAMAVRDTWGQGTTYVVFRGTDDLPDKLADVELLLETKFGPRISKQRWKDIKSPRLEGQMADAVQFFRSVKGDLPSGSQIVVTGHSLGGFLGGFVGAKFGVPTVTFDAPGIPSSILRRNGIAVNQNFDIIDYARDKSVIGNFGDDIGASVELPATANTLHQHSIVHIWTDLDKDGARGPITYQVERPELSDDLRSPPPAVETPDETANEDTPSPESVKPAPAKPIAGPEPRDEPKEETSPADKGLSVESGNDGSGTQETPTGEVSIGEEEEAGSLTVIDRTTGKAVDHGQMGELRSTSTETVVTPPEQDEKQQSIDAGGQYGEDQAIEKQLRDHARQQEAELRKLIGPENVDPRQDSFDDTAAAPPGIPDEVLDINPAVDPLNPDDRAELDLAINEIVGLDIPQPNVDPAQPSTEPDDAGTDEPPFPMPDDISPDARSFNDGQESPEQNESVAVQEFEAAGSQRSYDWPPPDVTLPELVASAAHLTPKENLESRYMQSQAIDLIRLPPPVSCGDRLVRGLVQERGAYEIANFNPYTGSGYLHDAVVNDLFEGLLEFTDKGELALGAAEAVERRDDGDGLVWTFRLRGDARWSNGDNVTADDFVRGLERVKSNTGWFADVSADKQNDQTIVFKTPPTLDFLERVALPSLIPVHQSAAQEYGRGNLLTNGPYLLSVQDSHLALTPNPYYQFPGGSFKGALPTVVFHDQSAVAAAADLGAAASDGVQTLEGPDLGESPAMSLPDYALSGFSKLMFDQPNTCAFLLQPDATEEQIYAVSRHLGAFTQQLIERGHRPAVSIIHPNSQFISIDDSVQTELDRPPTDGTAVLDKPLRLMSDLSKSETDQLASVLQQGLNTKVDTERYSGDYDFWRGFLRGDGETLYAVAWCVSPRTNNPEVYIEQNLPRGEGVSNKKYESLRQKLSEAYRHSSLEMRIRSVIEIDRTLVKSGLITPLVHRQMPFFVQPDVRLQGTSVFRLVPPSSVDLSCDTE